MSAFDIPKEAAGGSNGQLTMLTVSEILAYEDDPANVILENGYIEKGSPFVLCGPPGIGKSRLIMQLAIKSVLSEGFLGWSTINAAGLKWMILQNENGMRRLKADLAMMTNDLTSAQLALLDSQLFIHGLVKDTDGHLDLSDPFAKKRVVEAIQDWKPNIVIGDPLTGFGIGDLNSDRDMLLTARDYGRIVKQEDPTRIPGLLHHARTGKEATAGVSGMDRASYARNSKALYGWTRAQFNVAPANPDNNDKLFFASGKCNNAREFEEFIIELDPKTMFYVKTGEDVGDAKEELHGTRGGRPRKQFDTDSILSIMSTAVGLPYNQIAKECMEEFKVKIGTFKERWRDCKELELIEETQPGSKLWRKK